MKDKVHHYDILEERIKAGRRLAKADRRALKLQARENIRRLKVLNGEGDRIKEILKESIPREVFDREINSIRTRLGQVEAANIKQEGKHQLTQYIPWVIAAAALAYEVFKK
jgi:hypothetical protein